MKLCSRVLYLFLVSIKYPISISVEMRKDVHKSLSNQGWVVDVPVNSGLIYRYNENIIKEALQINMPNNLIFDMKSCSHYKMFRVCPDRLEASEKKNVFQKFVWKLNCRGNSEVVSNTVNSREEMKEEIKINTKMWSSHKSTNSSSKKCSRTTACSV